MATKETSAKGKNLDDILLKISGAQLTNDCLEKEDSDEKVLLMESTKVSVSDRETENLSFSSPTRLIIRTGLENSISRPLRNCSEQNSVLVLNSCSNHIEEWKKCQIKTDAYTTQNSMACGEFDKTSLEPEEVQKYDLTAFPGSSHLKVKDTDAARKSILDAYLYNENEPSDCEVDNITFDCGRNFKDTFVVVHQVESVSCMCDICHKMFTTKKSLKRHKKNLHKKDPFEPHLVELRSTNALSSTNKRSYTESLQFPENVSTLNTKFKVQDSSIKDTVLKKLNTNQKLEKDTSKPTIRPHHKNVNSATVQDVKLDRKETKCNLKSTFTKTLKRDKGTAILRNKVPVKIASKNPNKKKLTKMRINLKKDLLSSKNEAKQHCKDETSKISKMSQRMTNLKKSCLSSQNTALPVKLDVPLPFECNYCRMGFRSLNSLNRHVPIHSMPKYHCYKCSDVFLNMRALTKHLLLHKDDPSTTDLVFRCEICCQGFINEQMLQDHLLSHDAKRICKTGFIPEFPRTDGQKTQTVHCKTCDILFNSYSVFKDHVTDRHIRLGDTSMQCDRCGDIFPSEGGVLSHLIEHHRISQREARATIRQKESNAVYLGINASIQDSLVFAPKLRTEKNETLDSQINGATMKEILPLPCLEDVVLSKERKSLEKQKEQETKVSGLVCRKNDAKTKCDMSVEIPTENCFLEEQESKRILQALFIEVDEEKTITEWNGAATLDNCCSKMNKGNPEKAAASEERLLLGFNGAALQDTKTSQTEFQKGPYIQPNSLEMKSGSSSCIEVLCKANKEEYIPASRQFAVSSKLIDNKNKNCQSIVNIFEGTKSDIGALDTVTTNGAPETSTENQSHEEQHEVYQPSLPPVMKNLNRDIALCDDDRNMSLCEDTTTVNTNVSVEDEGIGCVWKTADSQSYMPISDHKFPEGKLVIPNASHLLQSSEQCEHKEGADIELTDFARGSDLNLSSKGDLPNFSIKNMRISQKFPSSENLSVRKKTFPYPVVTDRDLSYVREKRVSIVGEMRNAQSINFGKPIKALRDGKIQDGHPLAGKNQGITKCEESNLDVGDALHFSSKSSYSKKGKDPLSDSGHEFFNLDNPLRFSCSSDKSGVIASKVQDFIANDYTGLSEKQPLNAKEVYPNQVYDDTGLSVEHSNKSYEKEDVINIATNAGKGPCEQLLSSFIYVRRSAAIAGEKKIHSSVKSKKLKNSTDFWKQRNDGEQQIANNILNKEHQRDSPEEVSRKERRGQKMDGDITGISNPDQIQLDNSEKFVASLTLSKGSNKKISNTIRLKQHKESHRGLASWKCSICKKHFSRKWNLTVHMQMHGKKDKSDASSHDNKMSSNDFGKRNGSYAQSRRCSVHNHCKSAKCEICKQLFNSAKSMMRHKKLTHGQEKERFECDICEKSFSRPYNLKVHKRIHESQKTFQCKTCDCKFRRIDTLTAHLLKHGRGTAFRCPICSKKYHCKATLEKHSKSHVPKK